MWRHMVQEWISIENEYTQLYFKQFQFQFVHTNV